MILLTACLLALQAAMVAAAISSTPSHTGAAIPAAWMALPPAVPTVPPPVPSAGPATSPISSSDPACPQHCTCSKYFRLVSCERQNLVSIPNDIPVNVTELYLGYNRITSLQSNAFSSLTQLTKISLKNNALINIYPKAFAGLSSLRYLYLSANTLSSVPAEAFSGLTSLQKIFLGQNHLTEVPDVGLCTSLKELGLENNKIVDATIPRSFANLTHFNVLMLNTNPIARLTAAGFAPLRHLPMTRIELSGCKLSNVENGTFAGLQSLKSLALSYNYQLSLAGLQNIVDSLHGTQLDSLDISSSVQTEDNIPATFFRGFEGVPLHKLHMKHHQLLLVLNGTFQYFPKVNWFDLSFGSLIKMTDGTMADMLSLETLYVNNNNLACIPLGLPAALLFADLSNNRITEIDTETFRNNAKLRNLTLANCDILTIVDGAFLGLESLVHLNLSHNSIASNNIGVHVFQGTPRLAVLDLSYNRIVSIGTEKNLFMYATHLQHLDMSHNSMCDFSHELFHSLAELRELILGHNTLYNMMAMDTAGSIFRNLSHLVTLDLSHSGIVMLPVGIFRALTSLKHLDLSGNSIHGWSGDLFAALPRLGWLNVSNNRITTLNESSVSVFDVYADSLMLDLSNNPFDCYCELIWFRGWMSNENVTLANVEQYVCASPANMSTTKVLDFNPRNIHFQCFPPYIYYLLGGAGVVCLILIPSFIVIFQNRYRIQLKYYRFKTRRYNRTRHDSSPPLLNQKSYTSTLSYLRDDQEWVNDTLLARLSAEGIRSDRLFHMGNNCDFGVSRLNFMGQLLNASVESHKTIVILSLEYLRDKYSQFELEQLIDSLIREKKNPHLTDLIVIYLETADNEEFMIEHEVPKLLEAKVRKQRFLWKHDNQAAQKLCLEQVLGSLQGDVQRDDHLHQEEPSTSADLPGHRPTNVTMQA